MTGVREFTRAELEEATGGWHEMWAIGEGGFGRVYRAMVHRTPVAIKVMSAEGLQGLQEFKNEAALLSRLQHPHIVKLLGTCREGQSACLVYELAPCGNLDDRLLCKEGTPPLPWHVRVRVLEQVAGAVAYLHGRSPPIVHRDLKPSNVFLDADLNAQLGDVGLAAEADSSGAVTEPKTTTAADIIGDWAYLAPEIKGARPPAAPSAAEAPRRSPPAAPQGQHSIHSDVFALGLIVLQVMTGGAPAQGLVERVGEALDAGDPSPLLDPLPGPLAPLVGERLLKLGAWACQGDPSGRPAASVLHAELQRLAAGLM